LFGERYGADAQQEIDAFLDSVAETLGGQENAASPEFRRIAAEESLASIAERIDDGMKVSDVERTVWQRFVDIVRRLVGAERALSEQEILKIILGAREWVKSEQATLRTFNQPMNRAVEVVGNELGEGLNQKELRAAARKFYADELVGKVKAVEHPELGEIQFRSSGRKKCISFSADVRKLQIIPFLPELLRSAQVLGREEVQKPRGWNVRAYYRMKAQVRIEGKMQEVRFVIREDDKGRMHYDHYFPVGKEASTVSPGVSLKEGRTVPADAEDSYEQSIGSSSDGVNLEFHPVDATPRGSVTFGPAETLVKVFEGGDLSTVLHECGHIFLEDMKDLVQSGMAPAALQEDWYVVRDWLGLKEGQKITRTQHEQFARGFEAYLMEGKAPSLVLRGAFLRFRRWLIAVYRSISTLNVSLSPEMSRVFDRMLATEEEIREVREFNRQRSLFETDSDMAEAGMSSEEREEYERMQAEASQAAEEAMLKHREWEHKRRRAEWRRQARSMVDREPMWQLVDWLVYGRKVPRDKAEEMEQSGAHPAQILEETGWYRTDAKMGKDGTLKPGRWVQKKRGPGLSREQVIEEYGRDMLEKLPKTPGLFKKDGLPLDVAAQNAEMEFPFGWDTHDDMVEALADLGRKQDAVDKIVAEMEAEYDRNLDVEGETFTEERERMLDAEVSYLNRKLTKGGGRFVHLKHQREKVRAKLAAMTVKDVSRYDSALAVLRRKSKEAEFAVREKAWERASDARRVQLMAEIEVRERVKARKEVAKIVQRAKRIAKSRSVEFAWREHILAIGQRFELLTPSMKPQQPESLPPLASLLQDANSLVDYAAAFPGWLVDGTRSGHWRDLSLADLREVNNLLRYLQRQGSTAKKVRLNGKDIAVATAANKALLPMTDLKTKKVWDEGSLMRWLSRPGRTVLPELNMMEFVFREADGYKDDGPNYRYIIRPLLDAQNEEWRVWKDLGAELDAVLTRLNDLMSKAGRSKKFSIPGCPVPLVMRQQDGVAYWNAERLMAVALNMGNEGNLKALRGGYGFTDAELQALVDFMSKEEWECVQEVWDLVDKVFPLVDATHFELNNYHLEKVQAKEVVTKHGTFRGGYYPLVFDGRYNFLAAKWSEADDLLNRSEAMFQTPAAKSGFTNKRQGGTLPPKLTLSVLQQHLWDSIHYATHASALRSVDRIVRAPEYEQEFTRAFGREVYRQIRPWLKFQARPKRMVESSSDRYFEKGRKLATIYILAQNVGVAIKQPYSIGGAIKEMGFKDFSKGMATMMAHPVDAKNQVNEMSLYMANRATSMDREIGESLKKLGPNKHTVTINGKVYDWQDVQNFGFVWIRMMDAAAVYPIWMGAYQKAMNKHGDHAESVAYADGIVRISQPSSNPIDLAEWQRGNGIKRIFSLFMTFTLKFYNRQRYHFRGLKAGKIGSKEYMEHVLLEQILPPICMAYMMGFLRSGEAPEKDDLALDMVGYWLCGVPVIRDAVGAFRYGRSVVDSPALEGVRVGERLVKSIGGILDGNATSRDYERLSWAFADMVSFATGVPASRVVRTFWKGAESWEDGNRNPVNFVMTDPKR
jgi:hypothetical protein